MSEQIKFLRGLIKSARDGDDYTVSLLRKICSDAVARAPLHDLISIAECLCHIGDDATQTESQRN